MLLPVVGLVALVVGSWLFLLAPAYARPALFVPPVDLPRRCADVGGLQVEALALADGRPGEVLAVEPWLYGRDTAVSHLLQWQISGRDGQIVGQIEDVVGWEAGQVWQQSWSIPLDAAAEPARGVVRFGPPGALVDVALVIIRPERPFLPHPQHAVQADFGGKMRLAGYDWSEDGRLTLYWQALAPLGADYTTFVHVLDAQGNLVAQTDGQPQDGAYPTSVWQVGEFVADEKGVMVGGERPLRLLVGVYLLETEERLPLPDGSSILPLLTVE